MNNEQSWRDILIVPYAGILASDLMYAEDRYKRMIAVARPEERDAINKAIELARAELI